MFTLFVEPVISDENLHVLKGAADIFVKQNSNEESRKPSDKGED